MKIAIIIIVVAIIAVCNITNAAEYQVKAGDSWYKIANKISIPKFRYSANVLQKINADISTLKPGQKIIYLSMPEISQAEKWIEMCLVAGYNDQTYTDDQTSLANMAIKANSVRRFVNYAEAYRLGVKP